MNRLPFDTMGLAPSIRKCCVRSTSGMGNENPEPNRYALDTCFGIWSTLVAV